MTPPPSCSLNELISSRQTKCSGLLAISPLTNLDFEFPNMRTTRPPGCFCFEILFLKSGHTFDIAIRAQLYKFEKNSYQLGQVSIKTHIRMTVAWLRGISEIEFSKVSHDLFAFSGLVCSLD